MKFKDLELDQKFIIPITPHIEKNEEDIDIMCYKTLYKKTSENLAMIYRRNVYGYYNCKSSIECTDIKKFVPLNEDVIIITKEDY